MAEQYAMYGAGKVHAPETPAVIPDTYQQPAFSNEPPKVDAYGLPPVPGLQPVPPKPQAPMAAVPQALPPQMRPAAPSPETYFPPAPQAMPPATGMSVWQGNAMSGTATDGSTIFRDNQGQVYRYDPRFDKTVAETPNGLRQWQGMYDPNTQGIEGPLTGGGIKAPSNPLKGLLSEPETQRGAMVRGGLGAAAGGMAGSALLGPLGGLLGAFIGKELAQGRNPLQSGQQMVSNTMTYGPAVAKYRAQNGGFYPQNYYPKAPNAPTGSSQGNNYDQMAAISPRAADLISSGKTGLF